MNFFINIFMMNLMLIIMINADVLLFFGKTIVGNRTSINAFFNIIKGIKLGEKYKDLF